VTQKVTDRLTDRQSYIESAVDADKEYIYVESIFLFY